MHTIDDYDIGYLPRMYHKLYRDVETNVLIIITYLHSYRK